MVSKDIYKADKEVKENGSCQHTSADSDMNFKGTSSSLSPPLKFSIMLSTLLFNERVRKLVCANTTTFFG